MNKALIAKTKDGREILVHTDFGDDQKIFGDLYLSDDAENYIKEELGDELYTLVVEEI
jgi:hypothetical protein